MSCVLWEIMVEGEMCSHAGWGWAQSSNHMQRRGSASSIGQGRMHYINPFSMFLIGAYSVSYPRQFCSMSSVLQNQSHESPPSGAFLESWPQEKKKAYRCCSFSDGNQAMLLRFH